MTFSIDRRNLLQMLGLAAVGGSVLSRADIAYAAETDSVTIGWPSDVPSWDPNLRFVPDAQPLFKMVYDQPLDQAPDLKLIPNLITTWEPQPDGMSMPFEIRNDVKFHNGDLMTMEDIKYTFVDRIKSGLKLDIANSWRTLTDIEILSPTSGVMRFSAATPTAPQWLAFLGSYVVPKAYVESVGAEEFAKKPIGTGPYKLVDYQMNSRIVLERNEDYFGTKPKIKRVTIDIIKDPSARAAAIQAGQVDLTVNIPVREAERLGKVEGLVSEINPFTRLILLQMRNDKGFADQAIRLAAHHAIDKAALSKAFYGGAAVPLSVPATPGTPGYLPDYNFAYDPDLSKKLLADAGYSDDKPATFTLAATNGQFPSDFDIARALVQMWQKVGLKVELQQIEYSKYFELNRGGQLPEATLYSFDNATGDPEIFSGYLMNPKMPFGAWKGQEIGDKILKLFVEPDYEKRITGYKDLAKEIVETGANVPLLQSVQTLVRKQDLNYVKYGNAWVLGNTMSWS
ncbi:hypothetical protein JYU29_14120 [Tianweitania sp. BSSL-BM11]|uniref:Solute-binding protein family 5 domain-containing protein n=1 Tax=Tianweitania aestuarii TaxID=2814886 RepID=A0ABS5RXV3_9HYPH|nr:ABC transporter substrate-binding protein [Tianweitania aestuarii]MBS9721822.1 hypothetical protein [Tianweitania aestuarii]